VATLRSQHEATQVRGNVAVKFGVIPRARHESVSAALLLKRLELALCLGVPVGSCLSKPVQGSGGISPDPAPGRQLNSELPL